MTTTERSPLAPGDLNLTDHTAMAALGTAPWDYFEVLRREAPVFWNPPPEHQHPRLPTTGLWVLSKYEDVVAASKNYGLFSAHEKGVIWFDVDATDFTSVEMQRMGLMGMDPPQHTQFRRLVQAGFTPKAVNALEPVIQEYANRVIAELIERGTAEFVFDVAAELPMILLCELMGVPQERRAEYFKLANNVATFEIDEFNPDDAPFMALLLHELVSARLDDPDETLVSKYLHGEVDGRQLAPEEISMFFTTLSIAGHETTRNTTAHFVRLMDEHPDQKALLLEDLEGRLPNAIEEVLRYSPPVMQFVRTATEDVELRGQMIRAGDKVMMSYLSANRDEERFDDPNRFDILRENANQHVAFGAGPHYCLGAAFARMQLKCLLGELYRQAPDIALTGDAEQMKSVWFNALSAMPVTTCPVAH